MGIYGYNNGTLTAQGASHLGANTMTQWTRDLPAIEKQKEEAFNRSIDKKLADMAARIDAILLRIKK